MALTRAEAIDHAVRRHMKNRPRPYDPVEEIDCITLPSVNAIRAHFRAICRTYQIVDVHKSPNGNVLYVKHAGPEYDGHSLRH